MSPDAYSWLYFLVLHSRAESPDPPVTGPTWCYLWCWLRRGAAKPGLGTPEASCMPVSFPLQSSVGFQARSNSMFSFPNPVAIGPDPRLYILASSSPFLPPQKLFLLLVICSDHPLPSVAGNQEERERCHIFCFRHGLPPFPLLASWVPMNSGICWLKILCIYMYIYMYIYLNTHIYCTE